MNLPSKFRAFFRKDKLDAEMSEEMRVHLEFQTQQNIARGMAPADARHAARREFGGVEQIKEHVRDQRGWLWLEQTLSDVRFAGRALRKSPGFACAVVATLAVGIGLVTSVVNIAVPILWPDLPFPEAGRVVMLRERSPQFKSFAGLVTVRFTEYARHATVFSAIGAERSDSSNLVVAGEPFSVRVSLVTEGFFAALGVGCNQGRLFVADDYTPAHAGEAVVLSHAAWTRYFGRDGEVVGKDVMLGGRLRHVVGVLAPGFKTLPTSADFPSDADGIYLASAPFVAPTQGVTMVVTAIARLKPGITVAQAEAQVRTIHPEMPGPPLDYYAKLEPALTSLPDMFRESRAQPFRIFLGAAGALYLIGCTTVANLMLSRAVGRRRELGVRLALGGTAGRIVRLIVVESLVLAVLGAVAGTLLAVWAQNVMSHLIPQGSGMEPAVATGLPWRTLGLALALGIPTCALSALVPAQGASRIALTEALKEGSGTVGESRRLRWLRGAFVVTQSALAVALLIGAGLLIRTVSRLQAIELGLDPTHRLVVFGSRRGATPDRNRIEALNQEIVARIGSLPGVVQAAQANAAPLAGATLLGSFTVEGSGVPEEASSYLFAVAPNYFEALGATLVAGTSFAGFLPGDRPVAIVNQSLVREYFPKENPIGRTLVLNKQRVEIVGVVRDVVVGYRGKSGATGKGGKVITAQVYTLLSQSRSSGGGWINIVVRLAQAPAPSFAAEVQRAVFVIDPSVVVTMDSLEGVIAKWSRSERHTLLMLQILSGLALGLAMFGTFSVTAYSVARRRSELGLRLVLGATPGQLMSFVLRSGLRLGALGICVGIALAAGAGRYLQSVLYETSPHEPWIYGVVGLGLLATTAASCWLPARRAAKVDPMVVLRAE